ncbi:MAG TPA: ATP-binding protein [Phycisphaerae bacterium]|nr:ATP-binding protein [Phycisphaerae bacterium]HRW53015.1 ATP-binding protein [Phycisphaerae bacterium]
MASLRSRLLAGTTLGFVVILIVAGVSLDRMILAFLMSEFDVSLRAKALTLSGMIEQEGNRIELEFEDADMAEFRRSDRPEYFQVRLENGVTLARSASLADDDLPLAGEIPNGGVIGDITLPDGRKGRIVTMRVTARLEDETPDSVERRQCALSLARDTLSVENAMASVRLALLCVGVISIFAAVAVLSILVRVGLRPASALAREIAEIDERHLSARVDSSGIPTELRPITARLNELLSRLEEAFGREKTMTANIAHELRTPLAGLRSTLEVTLSRERDSTAYRKAMSDCLDICRQTQALIENVLTLARLDAGADDLHATQVDLEALLRAAWKPFVEESRSRRLDVQWAVAPGLMAATDAEKLRVVVGNLFANAVHYCDEGGSVSVEGGRVEGRCSLRISNTGSRIADEDSERVFDRFWRGSASRAPDNGRSGLGLAISRMIIGRLGGTIEVRSTVGGEFTIVVTI